MMYYGTQYYRPPFPKRNDWEKDIRHIKELNFNVVKIWAVWNWIESKEGKYDFAELDEIIDICKTYDLKVIINTIPEGAPTYTRIKYQDARYTRADGTVLDYSGPANIPSAGWPGLCQDSREARTKICKFIYETAKHFAQNDQVIAIDVWNEPHLEPMLDYSGELFCYCSHSIEQFREWIKNKYQTIENLNQVWFRKYDDWNDILPPKRFGTATDMIDWRKFWIYNLEKWMKERVAAAKTGAPNKIIQSHVAFSGYMGANNEGGLGNELGDEFLLSKEVDVFGLSSFPLWLMGDEHAVGHLINAEIIAESARGKTFYQTELQGGAGKAGLLGGLVPQQEEIRIWNWNILAAGGKGCIYWQYAPEPAGLESPGFGLVDGEEKNTQRAMAAAEFAKKFSHGNLEDTTRVLAVNGILLSRDTDLLTYAACEEQQYAHSFKGIYQILYDQGIPVRFIHEDYIEEIGKEQLKVLYLPMTLAMSEKTKNGIRKFVRNGGILIGEGPFGMYQENGELDMKFEFLREMTTISKVSIEKMKEVQYATIEGYSDKIRMENYRIRAEGKCGIIGRYEDGVPAVVISEYGNGKVYWINNFLGQSYWNKREKEMGMFVASLFESNGYSMLKKLETNGMVVRMLETETEYYLIAVNHKKIPLDLSVNINQEYIRRNVPAQDGICVEILK